MSNKEITLLQPTPNMENSVTEYTKAEEEIFSEVWRVFRLRNDNWVNDESISNEIKCLIDNSKTDAERISQMFFQKQVNLEYACILALFNYYGIGMPIYREQGFEWYKRAAEEANDLLAQIELGYCYTHSYGTHLDYTKAFYWHKKASDGGSPGGHYFLGTCYEQGIGTEKRPEMAFFYYQKAVNEQYFGALPWLACCYERGFGTSKNGVKSFYWADKGRQMKNIHATMSLARLYENGVGRCRDIHKAIYWYSKGKSKDDDRYDSLFALNLLFKVQ
ncbi:hypothetical protein G9A89_005655 [Geosiphon pyriformis]|nr:hypothetical protein G9A89_005655 [Geosiphon pyriformis]